MYTIKDYTNEINTNVTWRKYAGPDNLKRIVVFLQEAQWIPSQTTIERAIANLQLPRTDGGSARKDTNELRRQAQVRFDAAYAEADALPLRPQELAEFAALSFADLQRKYWAEDGDFFRARYTKAARTFGYRLPEKPAALVEAEAGQEDGTAVQLTAAAYKALSANDLKLKLRSPKFKLEVMKLIKAGAI